MSQQLVLAARSFATALGAVAGAAERLRGELGCCHCSSAAFAAARQSTGPSWRSCRRLMQTSAVPAVSAGGPCTPRMHQKSGMQRSGMQQSGGMQPTDRRRAVLSLQSMVVHDKNTNNSCKGKRSHVQARSRLSVQKVEVRVGRQELETKSFRPQLLEP